ncbi:MAG TPA: hypothetical protein VGL74_12265 [Terriglobales bacterium]|jgi:hypothetical protein
MKTEVYSWRVSAEKKLALESEAMREGISFAQVLDDISSEWLERKRLALAEDELEQKKLRARVLKLAGSLSGGDPDRASNASRRVKEILAKRNGRRSH